VFESDSAGTDDGPFIDDILIHKQVATQATATPTRTATPGGATATGTPTATLGGGTLGGKNIAVRPGTSSGTISWDSGTLQNGYFVVRLLGAIGFVPPVLQAPNATSVVDSGLPAGTLPCYIVAPTTGDPIQVAGLSNLACFLVNSKSPVNAPQNFTLQVTQAGQAQLSWQGPLGGGQTGYLLVPLGGTSQVLDGGATNLALPLPSLTCFWLIVLQGDNPVGFSDIACGQAGLTNLGLGSAVPVAAPGGGATGSGGSISRQGPSGSNSNGALPSGQTPIAPPPKR
jgi:hypothetical protein